MPYATHFLGFIVQYIPDINFKISLTVIKIITKLLQLNLINFKKYFSQLVTALVEKLADSKVIIRHAILKCCSLLIIKYKASIFAYHAMRYLQHGNWHAREGALSLIAHCIITQVQQKQKNNQESPDQECSLPINPTMIVELCQMIRIEDKTKIQQQAIDVLALALEKSPDPQKTKSLIAK